MLIINFVFMFTDNFVIYIFSFTVINLVVDYAF